MTGATTRPDLRAVAGPAFEAAFDAMLLIDSERRFVACNQAAVDLFGYSREELLRLRTGAIVVDDRAMTETQWRALLDRGSLIGLRRVKRADGAPVEIEFRSCANVAPGLHLAVCRDLTAQRRAEAEARRTAERLAHAQRLSRTGSYERRLSDEVSTWSDELYRILDLDPSAHEPTRELFLSRLHPDDRSKVVDAVAGVVRDGGTFTLDFRIVANGSGVKHVRSRGEVASSPDGPVFRGSVQDVTETAHATGWLARNERRYRALVEGMREGVLTLDADGCVTYANKRATEIFGRRPEQLLGQPLTRFASSAARPELERRLEQPDSRLPAFELDLDDRHACVLVSLSPSTTVDPDIPEATMVLLTDITERRRSQHEAEALQHQIQQMQKLETVGRLAGGIAHDFNNLLAVIINYAHLALAEVGEGSLREELQEITNAAERGAELTRRLLVFSPGGFGERESFDVNETLTSVERLLRRTVGIDIELRLELEQRPIAVCADRTQLEQVMMNLVVNARDAMPGGGAIVLRSERVRNGDERFARLSVADNGCGMPAEIRDRAFEPFFTTKGPDRGTGLGLATVYGIVTNLGGSVRIESVEGEGTTITVDLPAHLADGASDSRDLPLVDGTLPTILVAEDEPVVRRLVQRILEPHFRVVPAADGDEALRELVACEGRVDLLLTDLVMPHMSGTELAERITAQRPDVRVLFMSGYTDHPEQLVPGVHFIAKPFTPRTLLDKTRAALQGARA